jgi:hypothetical protein
MNPKIILRTWRVNNLVQQNVDWRDLKTCNLKCLCYL